MNEERKLAEDALQRLTNMQQEMERSIESLRAALAQPEPEWVLSQNELPPPYVAREPIAQPEPAAPEDIPACMFCGELIEPAAPTVVEPDVPEAGCGNMEPVAWTTMTEINWAKRNPGRAGSFYAVKAGPTDFPLYTATPPRAALNLMPVIQWLENGCDPLEAAKELRVYQATQGGPRNE